MSRAEYEGRIRLIVLWHVNTVLAESGSATSL